MRRGRPSRRRELGPHGARKCLAVWADLLRGLLRLRVALRRDLPRRAQILWRSIRLQTMTTTYRESLAKTRWRASVFYVMTSHVPRGSCPAVTMLSAWNAFCRSSAVKQDLSGPVRCAERTYNPFFRTVRLPRRLHCRPRALLRRQQGPHRQSTSELYRMGASGTT